MPSVQDQKNSFDKSFGKQALDLSHHTTTDPLTRFARDRRLEIAWTQLIRPVLDPAASSALVVCGGAGGEARWLLDKGFQRVVNSELSPEGLQYSSRIAPGAETAEANAEALPFPDSSFDLVLVQDGLHHLPRPVLGFHEMLRVTRHLALVIEPHDGLVARCLGTEWENPGPHENFVFRWNARLMEQAAKSQLGRGCRTRCIRHFNHNMWTMKIGLICPFQQMRPWLTRTFYQTTDAARVLGNSFIGLVEKK